MRTSEYTTPLQGNPYYRSVGVIRAFDRKNRFFNIGEIALERYDDQNYQYIFTPYWKALDSLPDGVFQGIPGINMDVKRDRYYRVNMTPSFISMRTPGESREDVRELMASVGLDYYDRFEWLLRSGTKCGDDNLVVVRKPQVSNGRVRLNDLHRDWFVPEDEIEVSSLDAFHYGSAKLIEALFQLLQGAGKIYIRSENRYIGDKERRTMLYLLENMMVCTDRFARFKREKGIEEAKKSGKYRGRKPIDVDPQLLDEIADQFKSRMISEQEAMSRLGLTSRSTFYRKIR